MQPRSISSGVRRRLAARAALSFVVALAPSVGAARAADLPQLPQALKVDEAFQLLPAERAGDHLVLRWQVAPGYYLYRAKLGASFVDPAGAAALQLPRGLQHHDIEFGDVEDHRQGLQARLPLPQHARPPAKVTVRYQGCADLGLCYPPQTRTLDIPAGTP